MKTEQRCVDENQEVDITFKKKRKKGKERKRKKGGREGRDEERGEK